MAVKIKKSNTTSFADYKALKDDIIEISEQRFENKMNKKFNSVESKIRDLDKKFENRINNLDKKFDLLDNRMDSMEKRLTFLTWFLPVVITLGLAIFGILTK